MIGEEVKGRNGRQDIGEAVNDVVRLWNGRSSKEDSGEAKKGTIHTQAHITKISTQTKHLFSLCPPKTLLHEA